MRSVTNAETILADRLFSFAGRAGFERDASRAIAAVFVRSSIIVDCGAFCEAWQGQWSRAECEKQHRDTKPRF